MLSDEEKQAIEYLKRHILPVYGRKGIIEFMLNDTLLNLIEKQQKEIEELKQEKEYLNCIIESDKDNYINKDKIKAQIEELEKIIEFEKPSYEDTLKYAIEVLHSLLEKE